MRGSQFLIGALLIVDIRLLGRGILPAVLLTFGLSIMIQNGLLEVFSADSRRLNPGGIETASLPLGGGVVPPQAPLSAQTPEPPVLGASPWVHHLAVQLWLL